MRKGLRRILVGVSAIGLMGAMAVPSYGVGASDSTPTTIEPLLVRSDAQVNNPLFRTSALNEINVTSFDVSTNGSAIVATISTASPILRCPSTSASCTFTPAAPYGGGHIMVLFQTDRLNIFEPIGCADAACTGQTNWVPKHPDDRFYFFATFGATVSEAHETLDVGFYDPSGRLVGVPGEPGIGQVFAVLAQKDTGFGCPDDGHLPANRGHNASYSFPNANTVQISIPYEFKWRASLDSAASCKPRTKRFVASGESIRNNVAFSWADHEIGGPQPVGLILGWTWYTDSVPAVNSTGGYKVGTPAGDPNPSSYAGPKCPLTTRSVGPVASAQRNPLYDGSPCMIPNPIGPGFTGTGLNTSAS